MIKNKAFTNAKWIIGCKVVQSLLQLVIGMLCARYLGPSNYGLISYAASIVAFALPVMQLGLRSTLVQEFVEKPEDEGKILGTSLVMNLVSSVACIIAVACFVLVANPGETETFIVCVLYSMSLIFQAIEMVQYWFQYKLLSKYPSIAMLISYLVVSAYKVFLLVTQKGVIWFVFSQSIDYIIVGFSLLYIYKRMGNHKLSFSLDKAKTMFQRSRYYIVSSLMVTIFANTDHVMLKIMVGDVENGYYAAAVTSAGVATFVYLAIIDSARPVILSSKLKDDSRFEYNMSRLYSVVIYLGLAESVIFTIFAKLIIGVLYGADYTAAISVLQIVVWYVAFSCMGSVRNIWILALGEQRWLWIINLSGALLNIVLNSALIPIWGACGAALASVLTQFFTNFIIGFIIKPMRPNNKILLKGLNPMLIIDFIKNNRKEKNSN